MYFEENTPSLKNMIIAKIRILDLVKEFDIELEEARSTTFDFRCKCPRHKNGKERTSSCYINSQDNTFKCFGGCEGYNSIDFYMLCTGLSFYDALSVLGERLEFDWSGVPNETQKQTSSFPTLLKISELFRKTLLKYPEDLVWIERLMKYSDQFIFNLNHRDEEKAKELLEKIQITIQKRYGEK